MTTTLDLEEMEYIYNERLGILIENNIPEQLAKQEAGKEARKYALSHGLSQQEAYEAFNKILNEDYLVG
jgi:hypothetical protein